jgi:hypothetical protein
MEIGPLRKMATKFQEGSPVEYGLRLGALEIPLNSHIGAHMKMQFTGRILCVNCGALIKKSFAQGYCYKCFIALPETDACIVSPEKCHYSAGTCRDPEWGKSHCFIDHTVYLANSSGLKVGVTRRHQQMTRWMDQGATQALPLVSVPSRLLAGKIEVILKRHVADRTDWRKMLKGPADTIDLEAEAGSLLEYLPDISEIEVLEEPEVDIIYPVMTYPEKIVAYNFDKSPVIDDLLMGIKGQYLIFSHGVINVRKFSGYEVEIDPATNSPSFRHRS